MREIRQSGSEGGEAQINALSLPLSKFGVQLLGCLIGNTIKTDALPRLREILQEEGEFMAEVLPELFRLLSHMI